MPRKEEAMPCKKLLSKEPQKRQGEIPSASSEDRQAGLQTIGERRSKETERQVQLSQEHNPSCRTRRCEISKQRERRLSFAISSGNGTKELERQKHLKDVKEDWNLCVHGKAI
ncbi:hypothetical protein CDAR_470591 [Caerostris darwini]|uniref:Uncharacterized protein n=1 Tax=Caerostris darwini TaxID=1538125 RepID=A0AAV4VG75_9ARAC|nr:hypothetical protein CDAR_470591 [Caerostris darwini]